MSDIIKLLPDSVANQIAAGEVIQRPASVIKELVENSIDAGATEISIVLKDAGRTLIQVVDNGMGMSPTDARLAFERHSTSKIRKADDLFSLHTMGFRGEALASIAAISQLELRTSCKDDQIGTRILISASKCECQEPYLCPPGCNFMIKNLFYNVPARRKFLKSNQVELSNIIKEFEKLALVNYNVDFTLSHNDTIIHQMLGGSFKRRILDLFGKSLDMQLIPLEINTSLVKITGFISKPENARKRNALQYFFVNGRYMRHPYFHKAVMSSYEELIAQDSQPNYFLNFSVEPESIDVNIHPTKTEIKFENEAPIWQIISAAVKEVLGKFSIVPSIDFDIEDAPEIPAFSNENDLKNPSIEVDPSYNPFSSKQSTSSSSSMNGSYRSSGFNNVKNWESLYENFTQSKMDSQEDIDADKSDILNLDISPNNYISSSMFDDDQVKTDVITVDTIQIKGKYIVSSSSKGMLIVDQHRAHVKVLYDRYLSQLQYSENISQGIMFPISLYLTASQNVLLESIEEEMNKIGFNLTKIKDNEWTINGVPNGLENVDIADVVLQILDEINDGGKDMSVKLYERISYSVAKSGAIRAGKILSNLECEKLIDDLLSLPEPNYTPDGKKIFTILDVDQISKLL